MPKDNREIRHAIRVMIPAPKNAEGKPQGLPSSKIYGGSKSELQEDELAAAFTQTELNQMIKRGDIVGNWKSTKKPEVSQSNS